MSEHTPPPSSQAEGAESAARRLNVSGGGGGEEDEEHWLVSTSTRSRESTPGKSLRWVGGSVSIEIPEYENMKSCSDKLSLITQNDATDSRYTCSVFQTRPMFTAMS